MALTHEDVERADLAAAHLKPRHDAHIAALLATSCGLLGIAGFATAQFAGLPFEFAAALGALLTYAVGFIDARREWERYSKRHASALFNGAKDDA